MPNVNDLFDKMLYTDPDIAGYLQKAVEKIYPSEKMTSCTLKFERTLKFELSKVTNQFHDIKKENITWGWICDCYKQYKQIRGHRSHIKSRIGIILLGFLNEFCEKKSPYPENVCLHINHIWNTLFAYSKKVDKINRRFTKTLFDVSDPRELFCEFVDGKLYVIDLKIADSELREHIVKSMMIGSNRCNNVVAQKFVTVITDHIADLKSNEALFHGKLFEIVDSLKTSELRKVDINFCIECTCRLFASLLTKESCYAYIKRNNLLLYELLIEDFEKVQYYFKAYYVHEEDTYIFQDRSGRSFLHTIDFNNKSIQPVFAEWFDNPRTRRDYTYRQKFQKIFEDSLGECSTDIRSYKDFNGKTFWKQLQYIKDYTKDSLNGTKDDMRTTVLSFYRFLIEAHTEHNFFAGDTNINSTMLYSASFVRFLNGGYEFMIYNPYDEPPTSERVAFIIQSKQQDDRMRKSKVSSGGMVPIDLSDIKSEIFRKWIYEYYLSSPTVISERPQYVIKETLPAVLQAKKEHGYPNPNEYYYTNQEAVIIRSMIDSKDEGNASKNNDIGKIRRFFLWLQDSRYCEFDDMFFDYLRQYEEPNKSTANPIPKEDLVLLNNGLLKRGKSDDYWFLIYLVFHLLLQTEFRTITICNFTTDSIFPTVKPNEYILRSASKTSHGESDDYIITEASYYLIQLAIERTEKLRDSVGLSELSRSIFLYESSLGIKKLNTTVFSRALKKVCNEIGIKEYSAKNLRDTHMTKALEHILRNNKSDAELALLTKHKHIDTTKNHYVELELEKMLESTYGIIIGDIPAYVEKNVVEAIPTEHQDDVVENGCGNCTAEKCIIKSSLPCMMCDSFITTVKHEPFFIKAIEYIDELIHRTVVPHDKDDLVNIKRLYVAYLREIYKKKGIGELQ